MVGAKGEKDMFLAALYLVIAAAFAYAAAQSQAPTLGKIFLAAIALVFAVLAVGMLIQGLKEFSYRRQFELARIAVKKAEGLPQVVVMEKQKEIMLMAAQLPEDVRKMFMVNPGMIRAIAGAMGPLTYLQTGEGEIPYTFVNEYFNINLAREDYLMPVRDWPSADHKRKYASWMYHHLAAFGYVDDSAGPNAARWADDKARQRVDADFYGAAINRVVRVTEEERKQWDDFDEQTALGGEAA